MASGGYLFWTSRFLKDRPHLDGLEFSVPNESLPEGIQWEPEESEAVYVIPTKAKTHRVQQIALGTGHPIVRRNYRFQATLIANDEEEYYRIKRASMRGATVNWVPFVWMEEVFTVAATGAFALSRPVAWTIAASANSTNHPAVFFKNDVAGAFGSITGQVFTATDTGTLTVRYLPAFKVVVHGVSEAVPVSNGLEFTVNMVEAISVG